MALKLGLLSLELMPTMIHGIRYMDAYQMH